MADSLARFAERPFVISDARELSYGEFARQVEQRSRVLQAVVAKDTPAMVVAHRNIETLVDICALCHLGAAVAPVSPTWTEGELHAWEKHVRPSAVIDSDGVRRCDDPRELAGLWVLPTSGSSGTPKGVVHLKKAIQHAAALSAAHLGPHEEERWLLSLPLSHVGGLAVVFRMLLFGGATVIGKRAPFLPAAVAQEMRDHHVTAWSAVPAMLSQMVADGERAPPHLRATLVGGAPATAELLERADALGYGTLATYGMTETCAQVFTEPLHRTGSRSSGEPLLGVEVRFPGGGLEIRSPTLLSGYLTQDGVRSPLVDGWFSTGDLGELQDGRLVITGRQGDRLISGGENVDPVEVEMVLTSLGLGDACVFGRPDVRWGQRVCAAVSGEGDFVAVAAALRKKLAAYKCPKEIHFAATMHRLPNGKLDRARIRAGYT